MGFFDSFDPSILGDILGNVPTEAASSAADFAAPAAEAASSFGPDLLGLGSTGLGFQADIGSANNAFLPAVGATGSPGAADLLTNTGGTTDPFGLKGGQAEVGAQFGGDNALTARTDPEAILRAGTNSPTTPFYQPPGTPAPAAPPTAWESQQPTWHGGDRITSDRLSSTYEPGSMKGDASGWVTNPAAPFSANQYASPEAPINSTTLVGQGRNLLPSWAGGPSNELGTPAGAGAPGTSAGAVPMTPDKPGFFGNVGKEFTEHPISSSAKLGALGLPLIGAAVQAANAPKHTLNPPQAAPVLIAPLPGTTGNTSADIPAASPMSPLLTGTGNWRSANQGLHMAHGGRVGGFAVGQHPAGTLLARGGVIGPVGSRRVIDTFASGGLIQDPMSDPETEPLLHGQPSSEWAMSSNPVATAKYLAAVRGRMGSSADPRAVMAAHEAERARAAQAAQDAEDAQAYRAQAPGYAGGGVVPSRPMPDPAMGPAAPVARGQAPLTPQAAAILDYLIRMKNRPQAGQTR